ncbi:hypothetical protein U9K52_13285 [Chryseobacterium sp. MHB01]|uniref:hypothetical protein n=1 Tax=Chryseobacterium sp. MHB01 TaxID=3109433 RepID=UPI002B001C46|nr:hypothetical protein [Chryseobacterium sp. MHB01]MEA1849891.1 hypothetical protein [Chryseobacterium sp. MHB01]
MKSLKTAIAALLIAGGTIAAFAFTTNQKETKSNDTVLYWFDHNTGDYLGQRLDSDQQQDCGTPGSNICADGYNQITGTPGNEEPVGSAPVAITTRQ